MSDKGWETRKVASHAGKSECNVESVEGLAESDEDNCAANNELDGNDDVEDPSEAEVFHGKGPHTPHTPIGHTPDGPHNGQVLVIVQSINGQPVVLVLIHHEHPMVHPSQPHQEQQHKGLGPHALQH